MPSSYLNDLRIELQADGENASTWGQKLNDALTQIGDALAYGTQDCFATDANATTTVADGAADPARAMYFKVTSTATLTATRTLTIAPNTISRVMFIENATTGSQSITISQGSGSTVTIATGKTAVVYLDGAGATAAVVDAMAKVDPGVTDTLAEVLVAGNATGGTDIAVGTGDDITFADNAKAVFGAGSDLQIYHDGSNSYISEVGTGELIIQARDAVTIEDGTTGDNYVYMQRANKVALFYAGAEKLATTSTGVDVTGVITTDGMTTSATVNFPDGVGAYFGTGNDLQIYHSGTESIIADAGTGNLNLRGQNQIVLATASGSETYAAFNVNGASQLYYDNSVKFATTSTGIDVTGTVVADGLESSGGLTFTAADGIDISGKESVVVRIDSDDNDAGRVFQVLSGPSASQEILIQASEDAGVSLYYDNAAKLATTGTGIDVTGSTVTDGLTSAVTDGASFAGNFNHTGGTVGRNGIKITSSGTSGTTTLIEAIRNTTNTVFKVDGSGNLILNDQSGNQNFNFNVTGAATFNEQGADADFRVESDNNSSMLVVDAGGDFVDIGGAGNIGGQLNILGDEGIRGRKTSSYKTATMVQPTGWGYSVGTYGVTQLGDQSTQGTVSIGYDPSGNPDGSFSGTGIEMLFAPDIHFYQPNAANNGWKRQLRMEKSTGVVFNENSDADLDFRVESNSNSHMLFVDAGNNRVGINKSAPAYDLDVNGTLQITGIIRRAGSVIFSSTGSLTEIGPGGDGSVSFHKSANMTTGDEMAIFGASEAVFNERSFDQDFRVESDGASHMLFVDASANTVGINNSAPAYNLDVTGTIHGNSNLILGGNSLSPGTLTINDNSTTAYTLSLTGTGTRNFELQGSASGSDYSLTMKNLDTGAFNVSIDGVLTVGESTSPFSNDALVIRGQQDGTAIKFEAGGSHRFDLDCNGTGTDNLSFNNTDGAKLFTIYRANEIVVNEDSSSTVDFRAESDANDHMLFVDAGNDSVSIGTSGTPHDRAILRVNAALQYDGSVLGGTANIYQSGSGRVFTFGTGSNGDQAFVTFHAMNHNGFIEKRYYFYNASGNWTKGQDVTIASNGTPPTITYSGNGATPTITVLGAGGNPDFYGSGFIYYQTRGSITFA
jgi:hypothetical protein